MKKKAPVKKRKFTATGPGTYTTETPDYTTDKRIWISFTNNIDPSKRLELLHRINELILDAADVALIDSKNNWELNYREVFKGRISG